MVRALALAALCSLAVPCSLAGIGCATTAAPRIEGDPGEFWARKGDEAFAQRRLVEAEKNYRRAIEADDGRLDAHRGLVRVFGAQSRNREIRRRYAARVEARPGDHVGHYALGIAYFSGKPGTLGVQLALEHLGKAVRLAPDVADYHYRHGFVLLEEERFEEARGALAKAVELAPGVAPYRVPYALVLFRLERRGEAVAELSAVLASDPDPRTLARARALAQQHTSTVARFPEALSGELNKGLELLEQRGWPRAAQEIFFEMTQSHPDLAIGHTLLGISYARLGEVALAMASLKEAYRLDPTDPLSLLGQAELHFERGAHEEARPLFELALSLDPFSLKARRGLIEIAEAPGKSADVLEHYRALLLLEPDDLGLRFRYAKALETDGDPAAAMTAYRGLVQRSPAHVPGLLRLASLSFEARGQAETIDKVESLTEAARAYASRVLQIQPDNEVARQLLARLEQSSAEAGKSGT